MDEYVAHRNDLRPWHLGMRIVKISAELCRSLANDLEVMSNPDLDQFVLVEGIPASGRVTLDTVDRIEDVSEALLRVSHRGMASRSTRSRIRGLIPRSLRTSTLHPSKSCSSSHKAAWSSRLRPGSNSTRRSISLCSSASPRATEPNTRTLRAPCLAQVHRIASRFSLSSSSSVIPQILQVIPDRLV